MTNLLPRPLTPLERAILRAVVELGDEAYTVPIHKAVDAETDRFVGTREVYIALIEMEDEGLLSSRQLPTNFGPGTCWRPAFDLTEVLREP